MNIVKSETLKQLENMLVNSFLTDDDERRFNRLTEKYSGIFVEIVNQYHLEDMPVIFDQVRETLRKAQIKEYFLEKEIIADVEKILKKECN